MLKKKQREESTKLFPPLENRQQFFVGIFNAAKQTLQKGRPRKVYCRDNVPLVSSVLLLLGVGFEKHFR